MRGLKCIWIILVFRDSKRKYYGLTEVGGTEQMIKMKKIIAVNMAAIILMASLTACGSSDVENMSNKPGMSEITENTTEIADTSENAISETPDEPFSEPETYEDYMKLADTYLQTDDVIQALAVLDEGIEKFSAGAQGAETYAIDPLSQRKEYVLAGTVAVRTKYVENEYDEEREILTGYAAERDEIENRIMFSYYGTEREVSTTGEHRYDANGNEIEYVYKACDSNGNISISSHWTREYDADGNEIEYISYDDDGNISSKTVRKYDAFGNETEFANYNSDGDCINKRIQDYDKRGNLIREIRYDSNGRSDGRWEYEYDENGNEIKSLLYNRDLIAKIDTEREYDENSNIVKYVHYSTDGEIFSEYEYEYDENGNRIKTISYGYKGSFMNMREYEYDESGREIYEKLYNNNGIITYTAEYEYDAHGNKIKGTETSYNEETEQKESQTIDEYEYDENENVTKYAHIVYDGEKGTDSRIWERIYDADGSETDFYLYINEKTASYHSQTEYDENDRMISYTEYDKNGNVFSMKETEYDADGNVIKESHYDADDSLIRCYENEYDDFGSITRQAMYEDGVLKNEKQISYVYHYIGNMDTEAADDFARFLKGQKEVCYYSGSIKDAGVVRKSITKLIDFSHCRRDKITPQYAFLDMTGDGAEELIINCDRYKLYVIQNVHGVLKVIFEADYADTGLMVKGNGRTGIYTSYSNRDSLGKIYYFLDENEKKQIPLNAVWESEGEVSYSYYDSFEWYTISEGAYYDITEMMTEIDIDWQRLEDPTL